MKKNPQVPFYLFLGLLFLGLKTWNYFAPDAHFQWFIGPTAFLVELFSGAPSFPAEKASFALPNLGISIDRSCAGFNFFTILLLLSLWKVLPHFKSFNAKIIGLCLIVLGSWCATLFINASRILVWLKVSTQFANDAAFWHKILGGFVYLFFLTTIYFILHHFLQKQKSHAQPT